MNGAESLVRTLLAGGVNVCFANPGTSEMHFVAALDKIDGMRCVLALFEGVVTGAADGYYRIAGKPAATLLHLGPGLGNGLANLHNAKKARSGIVNIVGEHATYHVALNAPLTSDIQGVARPMSDWVKTSPSSKTVAADGALAIEAARRAPGHVATLILPADTAWNPAEDVVTPRPPEPRRKVDAGTVISVAKALTSGNGAMLLLGGVALRERGLELAGRIAAKTGARLSAESQNARIERGAGRVQVSRIPYPVDQAIGYLKGVRKIVLVGSRAPIAFFAYPGKPSELTPEGCEVVKLVGVEEDIEGTLQALAAELGALTTPPIDVAQSRRSPPQSGKPTPEGIAHVLGGLIPERAIVVDESVSTGRGFHPNTAGAPPHDWLNNAGGSIGYGMPVAIGCAIAAPERKVIALEGDGSAMYTVQSLWTMARENLNVTVLVLANRSYQILKGELANVGAGNPGRKAMDMLNLDRPDLDWVSLARGHGVEASRATDLEELTRELSRGLATRGPYLVELVI
ncbi:MAG TPA: acetolactate synthase large subunit [Stellaceae bacterium]|nr:acetolactate synthase large subunit [Stellaceae bacterium]